jgi:hypothetical protein
MGDWLNNLQSLAAPKSSVLLIGNKSALEKSRRVGAEIVKDFAERHHLKSIEISAQFGKNVKEAFVRMALEVSTRVASGSISVAVRQARVPQPLAFDHRASQKEKG